MRWKLKIAEEVVQVELRSIRENSFTFVVDGKEVTLQDPVSFPFSIESQGTRLGLETWTSQKWRAAHGSKVFNVEPLSESAGSGSDAKEVKTQMPGRILKVLVLEGQMVEAGQTLIIMEAMKMENEIRASAAQKVSKLFVKAGDSVEAGSLMISFE